jgi:hypothetical protein
MPGHDVPFDACFEIYLGFYDLQCFMYDTVESSYRIFFSYAYPYFCTHNLFFWAHIPF